MSPAQLAIDGSATPPEPVLRKGFCRCGCGERVEGRMLYKPNHRQRAYRRRVKREMERVGLPPSPSLRAAGVSRPAQKRNGDGQKRPNGSQRARSGIQVSYHKALAALRGLARPTDREIERALRSALSPRQREVLDQRQERQAA